LSFKQLEAWSAAGAAHHDELQRIVKEIIRSLHYSSSPAKSLSIAMKKLQGLFSRREVRGEVHLLNNRHIKFRLAFPITKDNGLVFCLLYGEINARTGAVKFDLTNPIQMSLHALQRLFERLEDRTDGAILDEIYSSLGQAIHWHKGATEIQAKCWPLVSRNGFFIGTSQAGSLTTAAVTWIKGGQIGKKWGLPLNNLSRLKELRPERLEDHEFVKEFIRSCPWMLHEHVPGEDYITLAWEQRDEDENSSFNEDIDLEDSLVNDQGSDQVTPKISSSYVYGLNYTEEPPPFKTHTLHTGVVVQRRRNGRLIVGLKNGWIGQVPSRSIELGVQLISGYKSPDIGDDITVLVHKITHFPTEKAYALSLDPKEISDANWAKVESEHPIGTNHCVTISMQFSQEFVARLSDGIRGVIPASEVQLYLSQAHLHGCSPIGLTVDAIAIGFRAEKKCLLLSIRGIESIAPSQSLVNEFQIGAVIQGTCIRNASNYALIELSQGFYGLLHKLNNWGRELPELGSEVSAVVIEATDSRILLAGESPSPLEKNFYAQPISQDRWDEFARHYSVGDIVEVQNLFWRESSQSFVVSTSDGIVGKLPSKEVDWFCANLDEQKLLLKSGEIFSAKIIKIHSKKNHVIFSKKALEKRPDSDQLLCIDLTATIPGIVINVLDYGCFVQLQPYGIQGLLHRSKIPSDKTFSKGEHVDVRIDKVDQVTKRVALKLASDFDTDQYPNIKP
jgi:ribosomal protein S1